MTEIVCPGWPASWVNAWLAAVGATVLDDRIRLRWTTDGAPVAVLSSSSGDPVAALIESWPDAAALSDLPIADDWHGAASLRRQVPVAAFAERAQSARSHQYSWTLSSTMTDLCVDKKANVGHAPFDPSAPKGITLHQRLTTVHKYVDPDSDQLRCSLIGRTERVQANGLGFDQTRLGSLQDKTEPWVDPVVEVLAFFGLALLPVRGPGADKRLDRSARISALQRGWRQVARSEEPQSFHWPAWSQPLDRDGIDALLDAWSPEREDGWARLGVHAGWRTIAYQRRGDGDRTVGFGAVRL